MQAQDIDAQSRRSHVWQPAEAPTAMQSTEETRLAMHGGGMLNVSPAPGVDLMGRQGWLCESLTHDTGQEAGQPGSQRPLQSARGLSGLAEKVGSGEAGVGYDMDAQPSDSSEELITVEGMALRRPPTPPRPRRRPTRQVQQQRRTPERSS